MDYGWWSHLNGFWIIPLLCMVLMVIMPLLCRSMHCGFGHHRSEAGRRATQRERLGRRDGSADTGKNELVAGGRNALALTASRP